ncbi:MAG: bifunctional UDP-N-acetylglucosamine diphosphorylase/glucosamine-1-phosphate N-acetyltransferase GlmU, partial [Acidimicrobiaceae bacterium]|nr:bifunctional UDP-N-acetylglucosamine diphosphorylase/glucosamine-1-phosphate N-acetyltransferase GlmU [Acidimicrobiaceae bacterium]
PNEVRGVNDRQQLAECEAVLRQRTNNKWLAAGVTMLDPEATYIDATVVLSPDVTLFPNTLLQGDCVIGEGSELGPDVRLTDTFVGVGSQIQSTSAVQARIGDNCRIGPYAVLDSGVEVASGTVTGPFYTSS